MKSLLKSLFSFLTVAVIFSVMFFVSVYFVSIIEKQGNTSEITQQSAALSYPVTAPEESPAESGHFDGPATISDPKGTPANLGGEPAPAEPVPVELVQQKEETTEKASTEKIFYMSNLREKDGIESLKKYADKIDILAPQFYGVSSELNLVGGIDGQLKEIIEQNNIKVMPLVANADFKQEVIHNLLVSSAKQEEVIKSFVNEAKKQGYIGWQFDFENISYLDRDLYSAFAEKTAKALHKEGLILSVAAVSRSVDYEDTNAFKNWGGVFDYERLAKAVDFISLMTYDDPNSIGPVASLPFINGVLNYVKDKIPAEKLSLGIPLYNWGWEIESLKKVSSSGTYKGFTYVVSNFSCTLGFDEELGSSWLTYSYNNEQYAVWYQDKKTFESRLDIIKQNNFRGFSAWVLGIEDPAIWGTLSGTK